MEAYGGVRTGMEVYGGLWNIVHHCGLAWRAMEAYGGVWMGMEVCGRVWRCMEVYGILCIIVD